MVGFDAGTRRRRDRRRIAGHRRDRDGDRIRRNRRGRWVQRRARAPARQRSVGHVVWSLLVIVALSAGLAHAQTYPARPIKLIVPWPAGGGVDTAARMIADPLAQRLGQPVVVDNRPGAAGNIGTAVAAREKADGYTLLMASLSPHSVNPHLYAEPGLRADQGLRADRARVYGAELPRRPGRVAREHRAGARRARQGEPGQAQLRLRGPGILAAPLRRDVQHRHEDRHGPHFVQGNIAGGAGPGRRPGGLHARSADLPAVRDGRAAEGARRGVAEAQPRIAERADAGRGGHQGRLHAHLLRGRGAGGHAQGDRRRG